MPWRASAETIPTLPAFLAAVAGAVPVVIEVKSRYDGDLRLATRAAEVAASYGGPVALKSFDPQVVAALRDLCPAIPRGIVAETTQDDPALRGPATELRAAPCPTSCTSPRPGPTSCPGGWTICPARRPTSAACSGGSP